ncbi:TadE/TadG family type IV pilus assembly protein [Methylobacterium oxalidis]|uniref:TadE-like domain-containing protein n=1 Tax=Methylobacterium oxalidis TaxID=944322 RepID=A0A512IXU8_9HYPH|nr:TadE/TadG family type IV pilus assembly protein [Methylobacterium oxalidis]GEP02534.1 hypothetical protein MOX02_05720 [Methylobacterium oxalidis]GJE34740.1 hypothetical protein LDDCCGHA_4954 [Methylobacterium oxalidis]GLS61743.1 hypothetical protein GCM10007888_01240 [Methylobacterium oxalidis]
MSLPNPPTGRPLPHAAPPAALAARAAARIALSLRARLAGFGQAQRGAIAVEFALLILPFLALLFAMIEVGVTILVSQDLSAQLANASRQIYTGDFQSKPGNKAADSPTAIDNLRVALCQNGGKPAPTMFDCNNVKVNVLSASNFASSAADPTTADPTGKKRVWSPTFGKQYACGRANEIMVVQAAVEYPVFLSQLYAPATLLASGRRVIQAAAAFRIEPLNTDPCT